MLSIGIVLGAAGYVVLYYGAELWAGQAVSIASASGFAAPPTAAGSAGSSKGGSGVLNFLAHNPLLFFL